MRLGEGTIDLRRRRRPLGSLEARRKPPEAEREDLPDLFAQRRGASRHWLLGFPRRESRCAHLEGQRQVLDDLCRRPFVGRGLLPRCLRLSRQGPKDEGRKLRQGAHRLKKRRCTWSPSSSHSSSCSAFDNRPSRHHIRKRPPPATCCPSVTAKNCRISGVNSVRIAVSSGPFRR